MAGTETTNETRGPVRWATAWQVPVLLLALAGWGLYLMHARKVHVPVRATAAQAVSQMQGQYDAGEFEKVRREAELFLRAYPEDTLRGTVMWLSGSSAAGLARSGGGDERQWHETAVKELTEALSGTLDERTRVSGAKELARAYAGLGEWEKAREVLELLGKEHPEDAASELVVIGQLHFERGDAQAGEAWVRRALDLGTGFEGRVKGLLVLARGLRANGQAGRAEEVLKGVIANQGNSERLKDVYLALGAVLSDEEKWEEAAQVYQSALRTQPRDVVRDREAKFRAGESLLRAGKTSAGQALMLEVITEFPGTDEGAAARVRLAETWVGAGRFNEARATLSAVLAEVDQGKTLTNAYVTDAQVRRVWKEILTNYLRRMEFQEARDLIAESQRLGEVAALWFSEGMTYQEEAIRADQDGKRLEESGDVKGWVVTREKARQLHQRAAEVFLKVVAHIEKQGDGDLHARAAFRAAENLFEGGDYVRALVCYRMFMESGTESVERGRALLRSGQALAGLGRYGEAIEKFRALAVKFPNTLESYDGHYEMGRSYVALGDLDGALKVFTEVIEADERFSPKSRLWQRSLRMAGYVCFLQGDWRTAAQRLDETLTRASAGQAEDVTDIDVTFYLAESLRRLSETDQTGRDQNLRRAADLYAKFLTETAQAGGGQASMEEAAWSGRAACLYEAGRYAEAAQAYRAVAERYLDRAEGVTALVRMSVCLERSGNITQAREALERAKWTVKQLGGKTQVVSAALVDAQSLVLAGWKEER